MKYTDKQIESLLEAIHEGRISQGNLPLDLYEAIAQYLKSGLYKGFGGALIDFDGKPLELLTELRENVYLFSAAKTFQTVTAMEALLKDDSGELRSLKEFKEYARQEYELYNDTWARTEYDTAIASGQQGYLWGKIEDEAESMPYLTFVAVEDENTTEECQHMDGVTASWDDPIWDTCYPPNHFNCRSSVLQTNDESKVSDKKEIDEAQTKTEDEMQTEFKMNVGKNGYVYSPKHPYFDVDKEFKGLAKDNFGFEIPEED